MSPVKPFSSPLVALTLVAFAFLLHAPVLGLSFFSDDFSVIHRIAGGDLGTGSFFRPLPDWTLYLNYLTTGFSPIGFRVINVLLLGVNAWLVYLLGRNLLPAGDGAASTSIIAGLLFVCYPFHNEPQLWIIGRSTVMASSFILLALIAASGQASLLFRCLAVGICGWLGGLCYELALLLPILLLVLMLTVHAGERRSWFSLALVATAVTALNLFVRSLFTGNVANEYGASFFAHDISSYLAMVAKVFGRLFLPPHPDERIQLIRFAVLTLALAAVAFLFFRRTRYERNVRILFLGLASLAAVACGIGIIGGVSTRTSESDRFLYFPSAFLCLFIALAIVTLLRGWVRHATVAVVVITSIVAMRQNHANWGSASRTIEDIVHATPHAPAHGRLFVQGLPGDHKGAFIFRHGFHEALLMARRDTARIVRVDTVLLGMRDPRGVPAFSNENLGDTLFLTDSDRMISWSGDRFVEKR